MKRIYNLNQNFVGLINVEELMHVFAESEHQRVDEAHQQAQVFGAHEQEGAY